MARDRQVDAEGPEADVQQGVRGFSAAALRAARTRSRWSQADLATMAGVSESTIAGWERGISLPTVRRLRAVADALGKPVDEFLRSTGTRTQALVDLRAARRYTLVEAAEAAGISKSTLGRLENGHGNLSAEAGDKLAGAYALTAEDIEAAFAMSKRERQRRLAARADTP